jgi:hypothetical protein
MRVQKLEPHDVELFEAKGFIIADDGESAEFTHSGDDGELTLSIVRPAGGDKLTLHIGLPNGSTISGAVTNLHAMEHEDV